MGFCWFVHRPALACGYSLAGRVCLNLAKLIFFTLFVVKPGFFQSRGKRGEMVLFTEEGEEYLNTLPAVTAYAQLLYP